MATVIDALVVTLGLDNKPFKKGKDEVRKDLKETREDADKTAKEMEAAGAQAAAFFTKIRNEAIALFAIFTAGRGIKEFVRDITTSDAATGRLAHNIEMSTEQLTAWQGAAERMGGSASAVGATFMGLSQEIQTLALTGTSSLVPVLRGLGVEMSDVVTHKARPLADILLDLSDRMANMKPSEAIAWGSRAGIDQGTINLLMKGRQGVQELLEQQKKLGLVSGEDAKKAQDLKNAFLDLSQVVTSFARTLINEATPSIIALLKQFDEWLQKMGPDIRQGIRDLAAALGNFDWKAFFKDAKEFGAQAYDAILKLIKLIKDFEPPAWMKWLFKAEVPIPGVSGRTSEQIDADAKDREKRPGESTVHQLGRSFMQGVGRWLPGSAAPGGPAAPPETGGFRSLMDIIRRAVGSPTIGPAGAGGETGALAARMGLTPAQYEAFRSTLADKESKSYGEMGGAGGRFAGRYQMGSDEIDETARSLKVARPSTADFLKDPKMQDRFFEQYTLDHHNSLMGRNARYAGMTAAEQLKVLGYAHNQGAGGASQWVNGGADGRDAFGTSGSSYATAIGRALGIIPNSAQAATVPRGGTSTTSPEYLRLLDRLGVGPAVDPALGRAGGAVGRTGGTNSSAVSITGPITIHTAATDGAGVAASFKSEIMRISWVPQGNRGLA